MSIIPLQYGQCGNQIGNCLYSTISEDIKAKNSSKEGLYYNKIVNKWFSVNKYGVLEPRSVLIDTERKVVQSQRTSFKFKNIIAKSFGGSANNWACGYTRNGKMVGNEVMNVIRTEIEKCDLLNSFLNIYSSSGGTGSGVGSFIIEQLRDEYPNKNIVNTIVLPYINGEIVTQSYNSLLTLAHLYSIADSTILCENEKLHYTCKYSMDIADVSFSHMNTIVAQQLSSIYQPLHTDTASLFNHLTSHPSYKFVQIKNEPVYPKENIKFEGSRSWKTLISTIAKQSRFDFIHQNHVKFRKKTICSTLITRGHDRPTESDIKLFQQSEVYVPWLLKDSSLKTLHQMEQFLNFGKHATVISNNSGIYVPLNYIVDDAWNMFHHGAYLHHYKKYDIDEDFFLNSFQVLENILESYKSL